jgi:hypothetical protein
MAEREKGGPALSLLPRGPSAKGGPPRRGRREVQHGLSRCRWCSALSISWSPAVFRVAAVVVAVAAVAVFAAAVAAVATRI